MNTVPKTQTKPGVKEIYLNYYNLGKQIEVLKKTREKLKTELDSLIPSYPGRNIVDNVKKTVFKICVTKWKEVYNNILVLIPRTKLDIVNTIVSKYSKVNRQIRLTYQQED